MLRSNRERSRHPLSATLGKLVLLVAVLTFASLASGASKKDNDTDGNYFPGETTRVYQHTYDEVFQASQEAIERLSGFVTDKDKNTGTISGYRDDAVGDKFIFSMHIESLNTEPETRTTIYGHFTKKHVGNVGHGSGSGKGMADVFANMVQKVLSTYH